MLHAIARLAECFVDVVGTVEDMLPSYLAADVPSVGCRLAGPRLNAKGESKD